VIRKTAIKKFCGRVAEEFRPQKIILFGSYAYGRPTEASDVDVLVIMPHRRHWTSQSVAIRMKVPAPFPLDLLVRSPAKVRERLRLDDWFMREVIEKGKVLYEAPDARVG
jgi:uncharacterized protein